MIPLLILALCAAFGVSGTVLHPPGGTRAAPAPPAPPALGDARIYSRLQPSVVDVTATLRYADETASGTGFVVDARAGLILTNNHVIRGATTVTVRLTSTGRTYPARIVGADVAADIAVLKLQGVTGLTPAPLGGPDPVTDGTPVLAIGNRAGADTAPAAAPGAIDGLNRTIVADDGLAQFTETLHGMLQTSARIEPGDSGGPLAGPAGTVIGVDTAVGVGKSPAGYAIPIGAAMAAERQIVAGRSGPGVTIGTGGFLGVEVTQAADLGHGPQSRAQPGPRRQGQQEEHLSAAGGPLPADGCLGTAAAGAEAPAAAVAPGRSGALVDGVLCGTGAAAAGIEPGDVIVAAAGRPVSSPGALAAIMSACRPDSVVLVTWIAAPGTLRTSLVRLAAAPAV